jgi:hypothetical protein
MSARRFCHEPLYWCTPTHQRHLHSSQMPPHPPWVPCCSNSSTMPGSPSPFFSKKLNPAQQKYSAYDRELLAIYEAVKHFHHMLEVRHFTIFTDHEPITYAFQRKRDKCSPRHFNHLDFVAQFTTDIRHISGQDNVVANTLSRVESVTVPPSYDALATSQDGDDELCTLLGSNTALRLEKLQIPGTTVSIYCDTTAGRSRPYVPYGSKCSNPSMMSHPGTKATAKAGRKTLHMAGRAEGFPHLGTCLSALPELQSLPTHGDPIGQLHPTSSPFSASPQRPRWAPPNISRLHLLPHCSGPLPPLA